MKKMPIKHMLLVVGCTLFAAASGEIIVYDTFESGDLNSPGYETFSWKRNIRTEIVSNSDDSLKDWAAFDGDYSLLFRYRGTNNGATGDQSQWSELRFSLGGVYEEIWMSWWLRVPTNFYHGGGANERNYKLFYVWQSGYMATSSVNGSTIGLEFRGDGNGGSITQWQGSASPSVPFISVPEDRGRWMHIVVNIRQNSVEGASDGHNKIWRRWEGEDTYDVLRNAENVDVRISTIEGEQGFREGYLMGWHNGGYEEDTEWLVDNFTVSTESLFEARPLPPVNPVVR